MQEPAKYLLNYQENSVQRSGKLEREEMNRMIETTGYNGNLLLLAANLIVGMAEKSKEPLTSVYMQSPGPDGCDEWLVRETLESLRIKYDNCGD